MSNKKLLINEILFYLLIQILGLISAIKISKMPAIQEVVKQQSINSWDFIFSLLFGTVIILLALRFVKHRAPYKIFFGLIFFLCTFSFCNIWLNSLTSIILTVAIFFFYILQSKIIIHNFIIAASVAWASILLGLSLTSWQVIIILIVLSVYDMIAVWKTKHMITMFQGLAERSIIFALIIPNKIKDVLQPIPEIKPNHNFLFMGTGDLALPMIFAVSTLKQNLLASTLVILGALLGIIFIYFVFMNQKERKPVPALPPLAVGSILGFLISRII